MELCNAAPNFWKITFSTCLGPIQLLQGSVRPIAAESLTFDQTSQLRIETKLISSYYSVFHYIRKGENLQ